MSNRGNLAKKSDASDNTPTASPLVPRSTIGKYWWLTIHRKQLPKPLWESIKTVHHLEKALKKEVKAYKKRQSLFINPPLKLSQQDTRSTKKRSRSDQKNATSKPKKKG